MFEHSGRSSRQTCRSGVASASVDAKFATVHDTAPPRLLPGHTDAMATWKELADAAPGLATKIEARLKAHKHHIIATLRRDGSPRVSGTEVEIFDGMLVLGSMPDARKIQDLRRDPRYALHTNPGHHTMEGGDAKISGTARELVGAEKQTILAAYPENPGDTAQIFTLDIDKAVLTAVAGDHLDIDLWRPGEGTTRFTRY